MSFAIIETGGKQYKVSASKILEVEKLNAKVGETIKFKNVLLLNDNSTTEVGNPNIDGEADRGLFLINPEGIVMHTTVNKAPVGRNVDETLRILQGYQYVAANPDEVCPANWTPGEKTMLEDPKGSKEYFSAL